MPDCSVERRHWKPTCRLELGHGQRITGIWSIICRAKFTNELGGWRQSTRPPEGPPCSGWSLDQAARLCDLRERR